MIFNTDEQIKRAIRMRAGMIGGSPADVINKALQAYLIDELSQVCKLVGVEGEMAARSRKKQITEPGSDR
jgi:hypothetical protein